MVAASSGASGSERLWLMILLPAVYILVANFILERIFRKYMSAEDLEAEQERNQEFYN